MSSVDYTDASITILKYESNRIIYGLSEEDIEKIKNYSNNIFMNISLVSIGLGVPCFINAISGYKPGLNWSDSVYLNIYVGILSGTAFFLSGIFATLTYFKNKRIFEKIKNRPEVSLSKILSSSERGVPSVVMTVKSEEDVSQSGGGR
jgi:hypothetical protein